MRLKFSLLIFLLPALFGVGCLDRAVGVIQPELQVIHQQSWTEVSRGLSRATFPFATSTESVITVYRIDPALYHFRFANAGMPRHLKEWIGIEPSAALVINGVYFHEDFMPSGALVIDGKMIGDRRFDADKTGAIIFADDVRLVDTKTDQVQFQTLTNGAQTYPFLIKDGAPAVNEDSGYKARRSFIGTDRDGFVYVGVVPYAELSLYQLAKELALLPISWRHVLNLDGGPSTGLASSIAGEPGYESITGVPNVIVVERK